MAEFKITMKGYMPARVMMNGTDHQLEFPFAVSGYIETPRLHD